MPQWIIDFWHQHGVVGALAAWVILSAVLNTALHYKSAEEWVVWADANPKGHIIVQLMRTWGVDPVGAIKTLQAYAAVKAVKAEETKVADAKFAARFDPKFNDDKEEETKP